MQQEKPRYLKLADGRVGLRRFRDDSASGPRLVCFPYAGGQSLAFRGLDEHLPPHWELWGLDPPGHGWAPGVALDSVETLVDLYLNTMPRELLAGAVLYGHSLGGCVAFELARQRGNRVCSAEKANVMESGKLWREEMTKLHAEEYKDVELTHMYADNCAMQLLRNPRQFDVLVTDNLFGDILSDEAAMLTGSLGMLPSASLGAPDAKTGRRKALYEPVHGSAPDIAGKGLANPLATILSFSMCLKYSFGLNALSNRLDRAVQSVLSSGLRTGDIMAKGCRRAGTGEMGDTLLKELQNTKAKAA